MLSKVDNYFLQFLMENYKMEFDEFDSTEELPKISFNIGNLYLVQPGKYVGKKNWYKIGSSLGFYQRVKSYGSKTRIISLKMVYDINEGEKLLKEAFTEAFGKAVVGYECFEGDIQIMYNLFEKITYDLIYVEQQ